MRIPTQSAIASRLIIVALCTLGALCLNIVPGCTTQKAAVRPSLMSPATEDRELAELAEEAFPGQFDAQSHGSLVAELPIEVEYKVIAKTSKERPRSPSCNTITMVYMTLLEDADGNRIATTDRDVYDAVCGIDWHIVMERSHNNSKRMRHISPRQACGERLY